MGDEIRVCDTKVLYDTYFEAEVAAAKHKDEMVVYRCGTHFHISHADKSKRVGHGNTNKFARCPHCKRLYRKTKDEHKKHFGGQCLQAEAQA